MAEKVFNIIYKKKCEIFNSSFDLNYILKEKKKKCGHTLCILWSQISIKLVIN